MRCVAADCGAGKNFDHPFHSMGNRGVAMFAEFGENVIESIMGISPLAGKPAPASILVNVPRLVTAYYAEQPDPSVPAQRVAFGTSGHRGSAFDKAFNVAHPRYQPGNLPL